MRETYGYYDFEVKLMPRDEQQCDKWYYIIYGTPCLPYDDGVIESDEWFHSPQRAKYAAIGHISLLENGEG